MLIVHKWPRLSCHGQTVKMLNTTLRLRFGMRWNLFLFGLSEKLLKLRLGKVYLAGEETLFCWRVVYDHCPFFCCSIMDFLPTIIKIILVTSSIPLLSYAVYLYVQKTNCFFFGKWRVIFKLPHESHWHHHPSSPFIGVADLLVILNDPWSRWHPCQVKPTT